MPLVPLEEFETASQHYVAHRMDKMNPDFVKAFEPMAQKFFELTGKPLRVTDTFRTNEEQADLYKRKPKLAAKPGHSMHEQGMAMDIDQKDVPLLEKHGLLDQFGFVRPAMSKGETWHIELPRNKETSMMAGPGAADVKRGNLVPLEKFQAMEAAGLVPLEDFQKSQEPKIPAPAQVAQPTAQTPSFLERLKYSTPPDVIDPEQARQEPGAFTTGNLLEQGKALEGQQPGQPISQRGLLDLLGQVEKGYRHGYAGPLYNTLANVPMLAGKVLPESIRPELLSKSEDWLRSAAKTVAPPDEPMSKDYLDQVLQGIGAAPGQVSNYLAAGTLLGPVAGMAAVDALTQADKGLVESLLAGAKGAITGGALKGVEPLSRLARGTAMGTWGAGQALAEGGGFKDVTAGGTTMFLLGLAGPGGGKGLKETAEDYRTARFTDKMDSAVKQFERESAELYSGLPPPSWAKRWARNRVEQMRSVFSLDTRTPETRKVQQSLSENLAQSRANRIQAESAFEQYREIFSKKSEAEINDFYNKAETGKPVSPELQPLADLWRTYSDERYKIIKDELGKNLNYLEDYYPHLYKNPADQTQAALTQWRAGRRLAGATGFFKQRIIPTIPEARELGLEPRYENPVDMMLTDLGIKDHYIAGQRFFNEVKDMGYAKFYPTNIDGFVIGPNKPAPGWEKIDDRIATSVQRYVDKEGNKVERAGKYWSPIEVADLINNYTSPGFGNSDFYKTLRGVGDFANTMRVGLSGFHFTFETLSAGFGKVGAGMWDMTGAALSGDFNRAVSQAGEVLKGVGIVPAARETYATGKKMQKALVEPGKFGPLVDELVADGIIGGGDFGREWRSVVPAYKKALTDVLMKTKNLDIRAATDLAHAISMPLMAYYVPRVKLGAFADYRTREIERFVRDNGRMPDQAERRAINHEVWKHVDNVFGQLVYDNLGLTKGWRDSLFLMISYPGWNIGSFRTLGGALRGTGKALAGQDLSISDRLSMQYALGMIATHALIGTLINRVMTGEWPKDHNDVFYPRTGKDWENGRPQRVKLPDYWKDVYGMRSFQSAKDTVFAKANPIWGSAWALVQNKDFWGTHIYEPYEGPSGFSILNKMAKDPEKGMKMLEQAGQERGRQLLDLGIFAGKQITPFSISGMQKAEGVPAKIGSLMGIQVAPKRISNTPDMDVIDEYTDKYRQQSRTKAEAEHSQQKADIRKLGRSEGYDALVAELERAKAAGALTNREAKKMLKDQDLPPDIVKFYNAPLQVQIKAYKVADPDRQEQLKPWLEKKYRKANKETKQKYRDEIEEIFNPE